MHTGKTVAEQQSLALAAAEELPMKSRHCEEIGGTVQVDSQRHEHFDSLQPGWRAWTSERPRALYAAGAGQKFHVFCDETRPRSQARP